MKNGIKQNDCYHPISSFSTARLQLNDNIWIDFSSWNTGMYVVGTAKIDTQCTLENIKKSYEF